MKDVPVTATRSFPPVPGSTPAARRFVLGHLGDIPADLRDAISVMVSELAMNAVQHAGTPFEVSVELTADTLRVTVTDSAAGRPTAQPMPPPSSGRGRGLQIVQNLADDWGVAMPGHGAGKSVWFALGLPAQAAESSRSTAAASNGC